MVSFVNFSNAQNEFITTWQTTTANESITIPTTGTGYNYTVDWGDGTIETGFTGDATHNYANADTYTVKILGDFPRIYFDATGDKDKILSIEQWGTIAWESMRNAFWGCRNLRYNATDAPDLSQVTRLGRMFNDCVAFDATDLSNWDVSNIEGMSFTFSNTPEFNGNITNWNVSKVTSFLNMFGDARKFNQDISNWTINTSEFVNMTGMFAGARSFDQPIDKWDVSMVNNMRDMFLGANNFDRSLGSWDISNILDMSGMLSNSGLSPTNYDATITGWASLDAGETQVPSNIVLNADRVSYCEALNARDTLTDINTLNWTITDGGIASGCAETDFFVTTWQTTTANESITIPTNGSGYDYRVNWGDGTVESGLTGNATHEYATAGTYTVKITGDFPRIYFNNNAEADKILTVEQWGTIAWESMENAFEGCANLKLNADDVPNLSAINSTINMFKDCTNFEDLKDKIGDWNMVTSTNISNMFEGCTVFNENIGDWDTSGVFFMDATFASATSFNQDISNWDTKNIAFFRNTFNGATAFDQNLGNWNLSGVQFFMTDMLLNSGISQANYDATLIGWARLDADETKIPNNVRFSTNATYCLGKEARDILTGAPNNWTINDVGTTCSETDFFITTWRIDSNNEEIALPVVDTGLDFKVDWGDGIITNETEEAYHTYANAGTYTIRIYGNFNHMRFNGNADSRKIQTIEQWGSNKWTSMESAFKGCGSLEINATDAPDLSDATSMESMFEDGSCIDNGGNIGNWNVSTISSMNSMFRNAFMNENINTWNVSSVKSIDHMFQACEDFNYPLDQWVTTNLESAIETFADAKSFDQSLGDWDISNVSDFTDIFTNGTGMSDQNYDVTLIGWATLESGESLSLNVSFGAGNLKFCLGESARNLLTSSTYNWSITDGGFGCDFTNAFITTWQTTTANESITIPTTGSGYNYAVDWGDGVVENGFTGDATHQYTTAGTYTVKITGNFPRIFFNDGGSKNKILTVEQWGTIAWQSMAQAFNGCANLKLNATDTPNLSAVITTRRMFAKNTNFEDLQDIIGTWDTGNVEDMNAMFIQSGFNHDIGNWDVSKVRNFDAMFYVCPNFDQNLGNWDISEAVTMRSFITTNSLATNNFSTENYDKTLQGWATLDAGETRIPRDVNVSIDLTRYCDAFVERFQLVNDYNWRISDLGLGCPEDEKFITTWQTTTANETITIPTVSGESYRYVVEWGDNTVEAVTTDTAPSHTYTNARNYTIKITGNFPRINFNNTGDKDKIRSIEQWGSIQWISMANAFRGCTNLKLNADDVPDLTLVTSLYRTFLGCTSLEDLKNNIGTWNLENVTTISSLFEDTPFNENINGWNVSKVEDFSSMFKNNTEFNQPLNNWNTEKANDLTNMFDGATAFNQPIGMWNVALAQYFDFMFLNATTFDQNLAAWDISNTSRDSMDGMLIGSAMSQTNYDATLIGWATLETGETRIPADVKLDASTFYCLGETARNTLTSAPYDWTINDAGKGCPEDFFITTWQTTVANEAITIPTTGSGYDYTVDWGDGMVESGVAGDATHQYVTAGIYTVRIIGDFPRISFRFNFENQEKILSVEQWGVQQWTSMEGAFSRCSNLVINAIDAPDLSLVSSMRWMFEQTTALVDNGGNMRNWDVSTVEMMTSLFSRSNFNENIDSWNVTNVKNFSSMFFRNVRFNQNLNSWNTAMGERFGSMFDGATAFNGNISNWDTGEATSFANMFRDAIAFNQDISGWDTKNLGNINNTFERATAFDQDLGDWDISSVIENTNSIQHMFSNSGMSTENYDATLIGWARLDGGETKIPVGVIFHAEGIPYCLGETARNTLTSAPYNWTIADGGKGCPEDFFITTWQTTTANESITIPTKDSGYNYRIDWGDGTIETGFTGDAMHQYATAGTYTVKIVGDFPRINFDNTGDKDKIRSIEQWGNIQWTSFREAFYGCENLKLNADDIPDFTQVTELTSMFGECTNFEDLKDTIGSWDMSTIEYIHGMFYECSIFNEDISGWVFTNLLRTDSAFEEAFAFNQDISNWNMATVTDMAYMFYNATSFNQPVGNWTLGTVEYMYAMFYGATSFNQDLSNWDFSQVQDIEELFEGASSFDQDLSNWDISSVTNMKRIFIGSGLSQENYDKTLIGWATLEAGETQIPSNLTLDADVAHCLSVDAVNTLTSAPYNWTINDGGLSCPTPVITLLGGNPQTIIQGNVYTELGADVTYGAMLTIDATPVNVNQLGMYTVTYDATSASGEMATQVTRIVNVVGACPILSVPANNFTITTASETCVDKNNGILSITATTALAYTTTINGIDYSFTSSLEVGDLPPGTYPVCIGVDGFTNCEQCFEAVIQDAESLTGKTELITETGAAKVNVEVTTGTAPYIARINDEVIGEYTTKTFTVDVQHGDELIISSKVECEGKLFTKVNLINEMRIAPNPTQGNTTLFIPNGASTQIQVAMYNALGVLVSSDEYTVTSGQLILPMERLPEGVYFITVNKGEVFKIIKQ
ncbi:hypothetical protein GCM10022259_14150 [Aquimarina mytili]